MTDEPTGTPVEGAAPASTPEAPASTPEPWAPVLDRVSELAGNIDTRFAALEQRIPQPQAEPEPDPWAGLFGEDQGQGQVDMYGNPVQAQQQLDPQALQSAFQQALQQAQQPLQQRLQAFELQQATQQLYEQIPQLKPVPEGHPDFAANQQVRQQTGALVQQSLANYPPQIADALASNPGYIATVFKAAEAEKLAQGQAPASEHVPNVEPAGGAVPGGNGEQQNIVHQVYGSRRPGLPSGFGGNL